MGGGGCDGGCGFRVVVMVGVVFVVLRRKEVNREERRYETNES